MKRLSAIMLTAMMVLFASVVAVSAQEVQVRGQVTNLGIPEFTWDNSSFAGFYYDIDKNLGAETITFRLSDANPASATLSDQADANNNRGVVYNTAGQDKTFKFKPWGSYKVIGFLAERYFAAYNNYAATPEMEAAGVGLMYLADKSKNDNMMTNEQIAKVLMDDNKEVTMTSETPLKLGEGYQLAIKSVDVDGNKAYVELTKDGTVIDSKVIQPSISGATMGDQTYYYKADLGDTKEIVQIAVHFKNAFAGTDTNIATVDGEFQISDTVTPLKSDQQYDKMSIREVNPTAYTITMDNKDNQITLSKNKDVVLMENIHIKTADQDATAESPLRYYIYKAASIEAATQPAEPTAAAVTPVEAAKENLTAANENVAAAKENVTAAVATAAATEKAQQAAVAKVNETAAAAKEKANATKEAAAGAAAEKKQPGFEGIFAITGLLAVAYLVLGRKQ